MTGVEVLIARGFRRLVLALTVMVAALAIGGCGLSEPSASPNELLERYVRSTEVENDRWSSEGSSKDRMVNFAAYYTVEQLQVALFRTYECDDSEPMHPAPSTRCELNDDVRNAAEDVVGGQLYGRSVVVEHEDKSLELLTLYVVEGSNESVLLDETGQSYTDLEDFRDNNQILTANDTMLTLQNITAVPGEGKFVTVTGSIPWTWQWWLLGGAAVVVGVLVMAVRQRRRSSVVNPSIDTGPGPEAQ